MNVVHSKSVIWQVLNKHRFTGKIRISHRGAILKFPQIQVLKSTDMLTAVLQQHQRLLSTKLLEQQNKGPIVMISALSLLKVTTYLLKRSNSYRKNLL